MVASLFWSEFEDTGEVGFLEDTAVPFWLCSEEHRLGRCTDVMADNRDKGYRNEKEHVKVNKALLYVIPDRPIGRIKGNTQGLYQTTHALWDDASVDTAAWQTEKKKGKQGHKEHATHPVPKGKGKEAHDHATASGPSPTASADVDRNRSSGVNGGPQQGRA